MKKKLPLILILTLMLLGVCTLLYPIMGNWVSKATSSVKIQHYQTTVANIDEGKRNTMLKAAQDYNAKLTGTITKDAFSAKDTKDDQKNTQYMSLLDVDGIMGYIEIPNINVYLPIYHGTTEDSLQRGAGHLEGSALPVGGVGTHTVITAHRGLPNAKLFTDLDQLEIGDQFYLHVLGETLAYQIDQILVEEPTETKALNAVPGEDYATLMTCTPYGINTHRMFVRGHRVPYVPKVEKTQGAVNVQNEVRIASPWVITPAVMILFVLIHLLAVRLRRRKQNK